VRSKNYLIIILVISTCLLTACSAIFGVNTGPIEVIVQADSFIIAWDYYGTVEDGISTIQSYYKVYYRVHGTLNWEFLSQYEFQNNPEFKITNIMLDYGIYDFAISYVDNKGYETQKHSSLEISAYPKSGWYIYWSAE